MISAAGGSPKITDDLCQGSVIAIHVAQVVIMVNAINATALPGGRVRLEP